NCSFSSVYESDLEAALTIAAQSRVTIVAAAGNNDNPDHYLGDQPEVISVAATDENDQVTRFSNRGSYVDLAAPGLNIATTSLARPGADSLGRRQPTYTVFGNGTSFAAPLVSGAVALLQAQRLSQGSGPLTPIEARNRLVETTDDISAENPGDSGYGSGRLNLYRALTDPPPRPDLRDRRVTVGPAVVLPTLAG